MGVKTRTDFNWFGDAYQKRFDGIIPGTMNGTNEDAAAVASGYFRVKTGALRDAVEMVPAYKVRRKWVGGYHVSPSAPSGYPDGKRPIEYWYFQERGTEHFEGTFAMQRAFDEVVTTYPRRLAAAAKAAGL